jgi:hypothetical protein
MSSTGRMRVRLDIPPGTAQLDTWGNGPGGWWALVVWTEQVTPPGADAGVHWLTCAAWVHGSHIRPSSDPRDYEPAPRLQLGEDRSAWPPPVGRPHAVWPGDGCFIGVLNDEAPPLPAGYQRAGAGWSAYG